MWQQIQLLIITFSILVSGWSISENGITISTSPRTAGAIDSLIFRGVEYINAFDHGRELQVAITDGRGECYNPTEAGSSNDGQGSITTSKLLGINVAGNILRTTSLPAFWLAPGQAEPNPDSTCHYAFNPTLVSNWTMSKAVSIGYGGVPNAIQFLFSFTVGINEVYIQVEAPTGYLQQSFSSFYIINLANGQLQPVNYGPGEQGQPLVFATPDGQHSMGAFLLQAPTNYRSYARFFFPWGGQAGTAKWSAVWRGWQSFKAGQFLGNFLTIVCVGSIQEVQTCMTRVASMHPEVLKAHNVTQEN